MRLEGLDLRKTQQNKTIKKKKITKPKERNSERP